jgi:signal transduction histidine kinase/CheY-like chemotaxis protein
MSPLRILHLEDSAADAFFVLRALRTSGVEVDVTQAATREEYLAALEGAPLDLILSDQGLPSLNGDEALALARQRCPQTPFIIVSGAASEKQVQSSLASGATDFVQKGQWGQLVAALHRVQAASQRATEDAERARQLLGMHRLLAATQELSMARDLPAIMAIVRTAARELTGADGASFVLRDHGECYYADEDAITPLWKGQRFPMSACISGWVMLNRQPTAIEDIFQDPRIPADAYRPTFVKSLVMVPIRAVDPIGAIGNYWARKHVAAAWEIEFLQALANATAVAMESARLYVELEQRVQDRTHQLEAANKELESFAYSVSHDLRAPLNNIGCYVFLLNERIRPHADAETDEFTKGIESELQRTLVLIEDLLRLSQVTSAKIEHGPVNLSALAKSQLDRFRLSNPARKVELHVEPNLTAEGDEGLLLVALDNLLGNAWKYTSQREAAKISFGSERRPDGSTAFFVRDNGAGFDFKRVSELFAPFRRLHRPEDFPGTGIGLATVHRIIRRHGGEVWAESEEGQGATFYFTLPAQGTA